MEEVEMEEVEMDEVEMGEVEQGEALVAVYSCFLSNLHPLKLLQA